MCVKIGLFVPTYNAGKQWERWLKAFKSQSLWPDMLYAIDSSSHDLTVLLAKEAGFSVEKIPQLEFNHGGTRNRAVRALRQCDILVFLTQDAVLATPDSLANLLTVFGKPEVAAAYGRQLPHSNAGAISAHARFFNYPTTGRLKSLQDIDELGLKAAFCSNSFAAYRISALESVGGFPVDVIFGEDMCVAGKLILNGYQVAYCADALVQHSHDYSFSEEFRRYFDIGVLHAREAWLREHFGRAEGEGLRFVRSELKYLSKTSPWLIPSALIRTIIKLTAYRIGKFEQWLPENLKKRLSMNQNYWVKRAIAPTNASCVSNGAKVSKND